MRQHLTLFANFICKFGDRNLADLLNEVVLPAFTDDTLVRDARGSSFHLLDVELIETIARDRAEPAIAGQFVRDTVLTRSQVYVPERGLVEDEASLQTSPSSFFLLLLRDHRLIYFGETMHAPDLKTFESTMERFLTRKWHAYIDRLHTERREGGEKVTKKALRAEIPAPTLAIVPLTNSEDLRDFIKRYGKLQRIDITVHRKNDEISTSALIENAEAWNERVRGSRTKISTSDSRGLNKDGAVEALEEVTDGANETIHFFGEDQNGDRLVGDNEAFSVRVVIDHLVGSARQKAGRLYLKFRELVAGGSIRRPDVDEAQAVAIAAKVGGDGGD